MINGYNDYYGLSQYQGDNMRHPDGHSKKMSFDGYLSGIMDTTVH